MDDTGEFNDIPDSFVGIPPNRYPLVITYHKFLMMLDGTVGNSFFERFAVVRDFLHCKMTSSRSVALETFLRTKEVTYDRFCSLYWPHFNSQLTKKLDPSRVFTEIISHIKGGLKAGKVCESKLCREDYVFLSEGRVSTLNEQSRERIYDVFQDYEKMKAENCEFDLADLVNDLHYRLRNERCECDEMDFVYIDEVQDLTMRQIALFRYICRNVDEGFVFAGDTAQTIARGIDFRFQDIRSLFFHEFLLESKTDCSDARKEKGQISEILCLKQNFRTHDGVLRLAQSVVDLLYRFFQQFVDILKPEMSRICGEDPVLLESGNDENAIVTIFGKSGRESVTGNIVGFGAEQVILVRDDTARKEILAYVGKQALVLTIIECKGLEFQDVLLYNFFGSSPLKNHWRVIYEYMEEQDWLDANGKSFPRFSQTKHNVLCSELKQLYVAITRTRQRLWICENIEEISRPMFDYWKKKSLVQVRKLDDSLALAMQVASSPEEWKARGVKLFYEDNYEMATMCFERAGDMMWEKRSKAAGLKATADRMRGSNPEGACGILRQAADIFGSIGKVESAAECFCELGEYEKAGRIYLEKCGENKLNRAGECFSLAGCYELAAEVYAKGNYFSECLLVCTKGKLFDMGLQYIQHWKQLIHGDNVVVNRSEEIDRIEQEYLEGCALQYYEHKDNKYMMKFVRAFHSTDSKRNFLRTLNCLDELLVVEEELGNFVEAAEIAKLKGDVLLEAELLGRAEHFKEASMLMLWYVFANSLWASGNKGWPLKHSLQDEEILAKAKSLAKKESDLFFEFVCTEINIILSEKSGVCQLSDYRNASRVNKSLRGEVLSIRKILDIHLRSNSSKYEWEEEYMEEDLIKHLEDTTSRNGVSLGTLICFWNLWKEKIENIFKYLNCLKTQDINESMGCGDFCLNYFGVRRQLDGMNVRYLLLYSDAYWVKDIDERCLRRNGNLLSANVQQFVLAARNHFRTELLSVGFKLLETLEALSKHSIKNSMSSFCQSMPLIHIFEVSKYLLESNDLENKHHDVKKLQNFLIVCTAYFENVFPLDWRKSLAENVISLRRSELSRHLLEEIILVNINLKGELTYGQIGRVVMIMLGSGKSSDELCSKILKRFEENFLWKAFIEETSGNAESEISQDCAFVKVASMCKFFNALEDTYRANWRAYDYISPNCFFYLVERLLMWVSCTRANFLTTKSSFLEWIISERPNTNGTANFGPDFYLSMKGIFDFLATVIQQLLFEKKSTTEWINKSGLKFSFYYPLLLLRLVVTLCLIFVNCGNYFDILLRVLGRDDITSWLPRAFTDVLRRRRQRNYLIMDSNVNASILAEAFMKIGNPLVIVSLEGNRTKFTCPNAIFVDMNTTSCTEDILKILFPINSKSPRVKTVYVKEEATKFCTNDNSGQISEAPSSNLALVAGQKVNILNKNKGNRQINFGLRLEILNAWKSLMSAGGGDFKKIVSRASEMKVEVENTISLIFAAMTESFKNKPCKEDDDGVLFVEANSILDELKKLSSALDVRNIEENGSVILEHVKKLQMRRPRLETLLNQLFMHGDTDADEEESLVTSTFNGKESNESKTEETSDSEKGKKPLENSSNGGNAEGKGKGKSKGKKTKKGKGGRKNK